MPGILIIEDELLLREALEKGLLKQGWEVYKAEDGEEGFNIAGKIRPDLILLDIIMPKLDGMAFLKLLRESEWGKDIPVLVLTNLTEADKINKAMELRADGFLVKSDWKLKDLTDRIGSILSQKQALGGKKV